MKSRRHNPETPPRRVVRTWLRKPPIRLKPLERLRGIARQLEGDGRPLALFAQARPDDRLPEHPQDIEGTIAHEVTHLRWWTLRHGAELVRALLRGATFPPHTSWKAETRQIMAATRQEMREWLETLLAGRVESPPVGRALARRE
jgi:hypothetical protein